MEEKSRSYCQA